LALGLLFVMGILGAIVQRRLRAARDAAGQRGEVGFDPLRLASNRWLASLFMRAAMGLAAIYLMIGKPPVSTSLVVTGVAIGAGLAGGLLPALSRRAVSQT
jgi:phosphate/sulfate permease